ncbi:MAG: glycosyltransferase family 39 protein, partial [Lacunisphaera sp.]
MHLPGLIEIPLRLLLLIAGLLVPGSMVLRALRLPWSLAAAFLISSATLYATVLIFTWTGTVISATNLAIALGVISLAGRLVPTRGLPPPLASSFSCFSEMGGWRPLYLAFWAIVIYRLVTQPLSGPDVSFRWSFLAEQMLKFGSLNFYPPRTGADFTHYLWAESIPPGIASLYTWAYGCAGGKLALWTSPIVGLQLLSLHELIWRLAQRWGGELAARRAVLLAAACPLLTWAVLIGQETGMTALSVVGIVWCLQNARERNGRRWMILAGICCVVAASTREYGPIFAFAAIASALALRLPAKHVGYLTIAALPLSLAWAARVWLLTGNPFYSLKVGGLFPTNAVFIAWSEAFHRNSVQTFSNAADWFALDRYLVLWALPAVIGVGGLFFLLLRKVKEAHVATVFIVLTTALWSLSVAHTAGGLFYSLRVLSPAYALLAVAAGYGSVFINWSRTAIGSVSFAITLLLVEALPKTLVLPENPYRLPFTAWADAGDQLGNFVRPSAAKLENIIRALPLGENRRILTDNGGLPRDLANFNIQTVPPWSPEVAFLFDPSLKPQEVAQQWKKSGLSFVVISK